MRDHSVHICTLIIINTVVLIRININININIICHQHFSSTIEAGTVDTMHKVIPQCSVTQMYSSAFSHHIIITILMIIVTA